MISHYQHLMELDGMPFGQQRIIRGSLERLTLVMMTARVSVVGLIPATVWLWRTRLGDTLPSIGCTL